MGPGRHLGRATVLQRTGAATSVHCAGWPRADSAASPPANRRWTGPASGADAALAFFGGRRPTTVQGAIALADALEQRGRSAEARALISDWWRTQSFDDATQTPHPGPLGRLADPGRSRRAPEHAAAAARTVRRRAPCSTWSRRSVAPIANAVMALRSAYSARTPSSPACRPSQALRSGRGAGARPHPARRQPPVRRLRPAGRPARRAARTPRARTPCGASAATISSTPWSAANWRAAYDAMAGHGFPVGRPQGRRRVLRRLGRPDQAERSGPRRRAISRPCASRPRPRSPRAAPSTGWAARPRRRATRPRAQSYYQAGAQHIQTFYGQLAAEKAGHHHPDPARPIPSRPPPTSPPSRATRWSAPCASWARRARRACSASSPISSTTPCRASTDLALLMDMARGYGDGFGAMMVGRAASQRGFLMPERSIRSASRRRSPAPRRWTSPWPSPVRNPASTRAPAPAPTRAA